MKPMGCWECRRKLTAAKSRERGFGPVCWEKVRALYLQRDGAFERILGGSPRWMRRVASLLEKGK